MSEKFQVTTEEVVTTEGTRKVISLIMMGDGTALDDCMETILKQFGRCLSTMQHQNAKYGFSWRDDGLGPRSMFSNATAKQWRLKNLMWDTPPSEWDVPKIAETLRDRINYDLFNLLKLAAEFPEQFNEAAIQREVDKT